MFFLNYATVVDPLLRGTRKYIVAFSGLEPGDRVLDVGCATGAQVLTFARSGTAATGVDRNLKPLRIAETIRKKRGLEASFCLAAGQSLPFRDGSFDCAMMSFGLHENEVDAVDAVIAEMKRVVRDGGLLILLDFNVPLRGPAGIFIRTIEFLVGKSNYRCFRSYVDGGGLEGVLSRNRLSVGKRDGTSNKALKVIRVNNS